MFRPDTWAHIRVLVTPHAVCVCVCIHARTQHIHINAPAKLCSILFEGDPSQVAQAADHADKTDTRPKMPKSLTSESPASAVSTIMVSHTCLTNVRAPGVTTTQPTHITFVAKCLALTDILFYSCF